MALVNLRRAIPFSGRNSIPRGGAMSEVGVRKLVAEAAGTAMLVFFAVGVATLSFGFGFTGASTSAGVVTTAFAFGLVLLVLAYALGPISGCHINPAVTMGFLAARRITFREAVSYWFAQVAGAILVEIVLTFLFVFTVLSVTRKAAAPLMAGMAIGLALVVVHLVGIPLTGTSANPARSIGPALFVGGVALSQLWVFILAPLVGGAAAAYAHEFLFPSAEDAPPAETVVPEPRAANVSAAG